MEKYKNIETLPVEILYIIAMELDFPDILKFCSSSKRVNTLVCQEKTFWRKKLNNLFKEIYNPNIYIDPTQFGREYVLSYAHTDIVILSEKLKNFIVKSGIKGADGFIKIALEMGISTKGLITLFFNVYIREKNLYCCGDLGNFRMIKADKLMNDELDGMFTLLENEQLVIGMKRFNRDSFHINDIQRIIPKIVSKPNPTTFKYLTTDDIIFKALSFSFDEMEIEKLYNFPPEQRVQKLKRLNICRKISFKPSLKFA